MQMFSVPSWADPDSWFHLPFGLSSLPAIRVGIFSEFLVFPICQHTRRMGNVYLRGLGQGKWRPSRKPYQDDEHFAGHSSKLNLNFSLKKKREPSSSLPGFIKLKKRKAKPDGFGGRGGPLAIDCRLVGTHVACRPCRGCQ